MKKLLATSLFLFSHLAFALEPCSVSDFFKNISQSPDIQCGVWSGRGELCMQKAKDTGYLMLWFLTALDDRLTPNVQKFLEKDICNQAFCDLVNSYKYLILCCEDYGEDNVKNNKNNIYVYPDPEKILNESTGEYEWNCNGYPVKSYYTFPGSDRPIYCDPPPSVHLLKFDASANVIFHICRSSKGVFSYDSKFSPYASQFPIPSGMSWTRTDSFAPWLKQYLDMYPASEQIQAYSNSSSSSSASASGTNYIYEVVEVAITETVNPTVYQIALHRDNILFRGITLVGDILVKTRIGDTLSTFDERSSARSTVGKWFVNHDDTVSAIASTIDSGAVMEIIPNANCTLMVSQRFGDGFILEGYDQVTTTDIYSQNVILETGIESTMLVTNVSVSAASSPFLRKSIGRNTLAEESAIANKLYRITVDGNSTFDVLSTK